MKHNMWFTAVQYASSAYRFSVSVSILAFDFQSLFLSLARDLTESVHNWLHLLQSFTTVCNCLENYCPSFIDFILTVTGTVHKCQVVLVLLWKQIKFDEINQNNYAQIFPPHIHKTSSNVNNRFVRFFPVCSFKRTVPQCG